MKASSEINSFLDQYIFTLSDKEKNDFATAGYTIMGFGEDQDISERLVNSIVKGRKRAVATLFSKRETIPMPGSYGVIMDYRNIPRCLVKFVDFDVKPFDEVGLEFAQEDSDAGDVKEWAEEHRRLFKAQSASFNESTPVLCGTFKLVFKSAQR